MQKDLSKQKSFLGELKITRRLFIYADFNKYFKEVKVFQAYQKRLGHFNNTYKSAYKTKTVLLTMDRLKQL